MASDSAHKIVSEISTNRAPSPRWDTLKNKGFSAKTKTVGEAVEIVLNGSNPESNGAKEIISNTKLPKSIQGRFGSSVSLGQVDLSEVVKLVGSGIGAESDMGEKPSGEWLPEKTPQKKLPTTPVIAAPVLEVDSPSVHSNLRFTEEELLERLYIPTAETFWSTINKDGSLYQYLIETRREDGEELFESIKHDLLSWIYGVGDKSTHSVEQFIKGIAVIRTKIKEDLRGHPIMCSLIDFVSTPDFYKTYINTSKSVIGCFLDIKVKPVYNQQLINELWNNFRGIIKRNSSVEDYNLYVSGIALLAQKNTDGKELINWCFMYPGKEELVKSYIDIFDDELIYTFVEYAKGFLALGPGFHKLIQIKYGYRNVQSRS